MENHRGTGDDKPGCTSGTPVAIESGTQAEADWTSAAAARSKAGDVDDGTHAEEDRTGA